LLADTAATYIGEYLCRVHVHISHATAIATTSATRKLIVTKTSTLHATASAIASAAIVSAMQNSPLAAAPCAELRCHPSHRPPTDQQPLMKSHRSGTTLTLGVAIAIATTTTTTTRIRSRVRIRIRTHTQVRTHALYTG
jgi:hypothetical protein